LGILDIIGTIHRALNHNNTTANRNLATVIGSQIAEKEKITAFHFLCTSVSGSFISCTVLFIFVL
jgi:hypothetical protein